MFSIGIDVGGMSIKFGLVNDRGEIVYKTSVKTANSPEQVILDIFDKVDNVLSTNSLTINDIDGIGIGCPGALDVVNGVVVHLPNIPGWTDIPLVQLLKKRLNTQIKISNDANVAALGEVVYGCAKNYNLAVMFTIGTGVGGGIIIDKKVFEGGYSRGAELGHATLIMNGEPCTCGRRGCIEQYISATALIKQTKTAMLNDKSSAMWKFVNGDLENVDGRTAFECSKNGDLTAIKVVDEYIAYFGESLLNMFNIFRPEAFIIGGGLSAQGEYLTNKLKNYCEKFDYGYKNAPRTDILTATLGNDAGIIGAAALLK